MEQFTIKQVKKIFPIYKKEDLFPETDCEIEGNDYFCSARHKLYIGRLKKVYKLGYYVSIFKSFNAKFDGITYDSFGHYDNPEDYWERICDQYITDLGYDWEKDKEEIKKIEENLSKEQIAQFKKQAIEQYSLTPKEQREEEKVKKIYYGYEKRFTDFYVELFDNYEFYYLIGEYYPHSELKKIKTKKSFKNKVIVSLRDRASRTFFVPELGAIMTLAFDLNTCLILKKENYKQIMKTIRTFAKKYELHSYKERD